MEASRYEPGPVRPVVGPMVGEVRCHVTGADQITSKISHHLKELRLAGLITGSLYDETEAAAIPEAALLASLGCGNPTALAGLKPGEVVLGLGSGGGIDVLLSARRVGPTGFAYGLDLTDEMLALARKNQAEAAVTNVQFLTWPWLALSARIRSGVRTGMT